MHDLLSNSMTSGPSLLVLVSIWMVARGIKILLYIYVNLDIRPLGLYFDVTLEREFFKEEN